jgi:hypothetical protein
MDYSSKETWVKTPTGWKIKMIEELPGAKAKSM